MFFRLYTRGVHISMGKFQSGVHKKHITVPGCILLPYYKKYRSWAFWSREMRVLGTCFPYFLAAFPSIEQHWEKKLRSITLIEYWYAAIDIGHTTRTWGSTGHFLFRYPRKVRVKSSKILNKKGPKNTYSRQKCVFVPLKHRKEEIGHNPFHILTFQINNAFNYSISWTVNMFSWKLWCLDKLR